MKFVRKAGFAAGVLLASTALGFPAAYANGMGTPIEPPPETPVPMPPPAAPTPAPVMEMPASNWSGFYIGGHIGYGFQSDDDDEVVLFDKNLDGVFDDTITTAAGANAFAPGFCGGTAIDGTAASGCKNDSDGIDAGLRAGYDWQFGSFVIGGVIEASYVDVSDAVSAFSSTPASYTFERELNFMAAARLRAGFAADDFLIYGTGGFALGDVERTFRTTNAANSFDPLKNDDTLYGYQVGGGVEYRLSQSMSLGLEYLYTDLDDDDYIVRVGPGTAPATNPFLLTNANGTDITREDDSFDFHTVRAVLNFRL